AGPSHRHTRAAPSDAAQTCCGVSRCVAAGTDTAPDRPPTGRATRTSRPSTSPDHPDAAPLGIDRDQMAWIEPLQIAEQLARPGQPPSVMLHVVESDDPPEPPVPLPVR